MAAAADCSLQAVLLGAIRHYAESVLGRPVAGYLTPLPNAPRYDRATLSTRPVIRIPVAWLAGVVDAVGAKTGESRPQVVQSAVGALQRACWPHARPYDPTNPADVEAFGAAIRADITPARREHATRHNHQAVA